MQSFRDWLNAQESSPTTRALDAPWAYPALYVGGNPFSNGYSPGRIRNYNRMIKRDSRKKKVRRPNNSIDGFVREMELLKQDLAKLAEKKRKERQSKPQDQSDQSKSTKPIKVEIDNDLKKVAKVVLSNLNRAPDYYSRLSKIDRLAGIEKAPVMKKVKRDDVRQVARDLGIDFEKVKFTPEAFRKGIESELQNESPSKSGKEDQDQDDNKKN